MLRPGRNTFHVCFLVLSSGHRAVRAEPLVCGSLRVVGLTLNQAFINMTLILSALMDRNADW